MWNPGSGLVLDCIEKIHKTISAHLLISQCFTLNRSQFKTSKCMLVQKESYCMVCASVLTIIHSLKLVDYLPVQTHKPYSKCTRDEKKWICK